MKLISKGIKMKLLITLFSSTMFLLASVDINTATADELSTLKGIGSKKAQTIIKYRNSIKCFNSIDELTKVKGIGKATITKNKDNLKISECKK